MSESWGVPLFVLAVLIFFGWFVFGTQWNIRKGDAVLKWLRQGLPLVGERTTMRWMGSSVLELKIAKASNPFRTAETVIIFEPRDVPFLWALARWRGRRDTLIFRSQLHTAPSFEMEAFDPKGWTSGGIERRARSKNWQQPNSTVSQPFAVFLSAQGNPTMAKKLVDSASHAGGRLLRISVHRDVPNLEIHWVLPDAKTCSARDLYLKMRQMSEDVMQG